MTLDLGDRAVLRQLERSDADELHALIEANRAHLLPWMPWAGQDAAATGAFLQAAGEQAAAGDGVQFAVIEHGRIVGTTGFHRVDWRNAATSIGYWLAADAQGRGLITRGVAAMLDHAFGPWGCIASRSARRRTTRAAGPSPSASGSPWRARCATPSATPRLRRPCPPRPARARVAPAPSIASSHGQDLRGDHA